MTSVVPSIQPEIEIPEIIEVSKSSFRMSGSKVIVSMETNTGTPVQFIISFDKFLTGVTAAVTFLNLNLAQLFDLIGGP